MTHRMQWGLKLLVRDERHAGRRNRVLSVESELEQERLVLCRIERVDMSKKSAPHTLS